MAALTYVFLIIPLKQNNYIFPICNLFVIINKFDALHFFVVKLSL